MRKKYDWDKLKQEFIEGSWLTLSAFFEQKGIKYSSYARSKAAGWIEAREKYQTINPFQN